MTISVIIPVYNTETYLDQCIQSVLAQTYKNWEMLLINDGSTDSSGTICDKYAAKDPRIQVIHQTNSGVTAARRAGVERARGEYLYFVDADDSIANDTLEYMLKHMSDGVDMVAEWNHTCQLDRDSFCQALFKQQGWYVYGKLYRKHLFHDDTLSASRYFKIGEDFLMQLRIARFLEGKIVGVAEQKYRYNTENPNSAMANYVRSYEYEVRMLEEVASIMKQIPESPIIERAYFDHRLRYLAGMIGFRYPIDYNAEWVQNIYAESQQHKLKLKQKIQKKAIANRYVRWGFILEKKCRELGRRLRKLIKAL